MDQQEPLAIPGEPRLSQRIREAANRDALGRAAVLSGQGDLAAAARFTAAALLCRGGGQPSVPTAGRSCGTSTPTC